jgi:hypothetical protein
MHKRIAEELFDSHGGGFRYYRVASYIFFMILFNSVVLIEDDISSWLASAKEY